MLNQALSGSGKFGRLKDLKNQHIIKHISSKETPEQLRNKVTDTYLSGKGYKAISKALAFQSNTVRAIIKQMVNLSRSGQPTKITPRAHQ